MKFKLKQKEIFLLHGLSRFGTLTTAPCSQPD